MRLLSLAFTLLLSFQLQAQMPEDIITRDLVEGQLKFIASDELQGRRTGEAGNNIAARYIAEQLRSSGVKTIPGQEDYLQPIPFTQFSPPASGAIAWEDKLFTHGDNMVVATGEAIDIEAKVVFAGYGLEDEAKGWNDYKGVKAEGKIVVVVGGVPDSKDPLAIFGSMKTKRELAQAKGAVALIELFRLPFPWEFFKQYMNSERLVLPDADPNANKNFTYIWLKEDNKEDALKWKKKKTKFKLKHSGVNKSERPSQNVIGYVPGTDPSLAKEYVIVTAHYDHVGTGKNGGGYYTPEDSIFNGARDNAMGVVAMLGAAQVVAKNPCKRPVVFLGFTGEEMGLLGSKYYVDNPIIPLKETIYNLNSDGAGYNDKSSISIIGWNRTGVDAAVEGATNAIGLGIIKDPAPEQGLFDRSDNVSFAVMGVPCLTFAPGVTDFNDELNKYYHQAADNPDTIDFDYLQKFVKALSLTCRNIANGSLRPQWKAGDKYEQAGKDLYGSK